jgi:hypothetical protein
VRSIDPLALEDRELGERVWKFHNRLRWALWGVALSLAMVIAALLLVQAF